MSGVVTVKATLRTRCGCWQHMDVPYPPPPQVILKLKPRPLNLFKGGQPKALEVRYFDLQDFGAKYADYEERPS